MLGGLAGLVMVGGLRKKESKSDIGGKIRKKGFTFLFL